MSEPDGSQDLLRSLRERVEEVDGAHARLSADARFASLSGALGVVLVAFTAMSWAVSPDGDVSLTLWDLAGEDSPQGVVAVLAILVLGVGTGVVALLPDPGKVSLGALVGLALVVAVLVLVVEGAYPTDFGSFGDETVYESDPARWLTLVTALVLSVVHGARLGQLHPGDTRQLRNGRY
jgi:hypothetical protein